MRAMRLIDQHPAEDNPLALVDLSIPDPGHGQVLLKVQACGVCHTDLHTIEGDIHPPRLPITPGHQVVGRVSKIGPLRKDWLVNRPMPQIGQRVGLPWLHAACGECEFCRRGLENLCPKATFTGFHLDGGYAEYVLADARYVLSLPDELTDEQAAPLLCAGIIGYRSLRLADLQPGERLGLIGFGASAHLAIQVARYWGCEVYVFTRAVDHRRHAEELGAIWTGAIEDNPRISLDRAVIFAPAGALVPLALTKIRPGGIVVINAIHMSPIPEMPYNLLYGERTLRSVTNATYQDGVEFIHLATDIPLRPTTNLFPLEKANQALLELKHSQLNGEAVLFI
jgi:alcohol dehydrogenase, propanol-preferring